MLGYSLLGVSWDLFVDLLESFIHSLFQQDLDYVSGQRKDWSINTVHTLDMQTPIHTSLSRRESQSENTNSRITREFEVEGNSNERQERGREKKRCRYNQQCYKPTHGMG